MGNAPYVEPVKGKYTLVGVGLKWTDNDGPSLDSVKFSTKFAADTFNKLSGGQLQYDAQAYIVDVPFTHDSANVGHATKYAREQLQKDHNIPDSKDTHYIMVNNNAKGEHNSYTEPGGHVSNLLNCLAVTFCHELGRQAPTILGGSAAMRDGKMEWQADGTSFMSRFSSSSLTAPQLYYLGWLPNTQVELFDKSAQSQDYTLQNLDDFKDQNTKAVMIQDGDETLFLSRPTFRKDGVLYTLHKGEGQDEKASLRLVVFGQKGTYKDLSFNGDNNGKVTITRGSAQAQASDTPVSDMQLSDANNVDASQTPSETDEPHASGKTDGASGQQQAAKTTDTVHPTDTITGKTAVGTNSQPKRDGSESPVVPSDTPTIKPQPSNPAGKPGEPAVSPKENISNQPKNDDAPFGPKVQGQPDVKPGVQLPKNPTPNPGSANPAVPNTQGTQDAPRAAQSDKPKMMTQEEINRRPHRA